MPAYIAIADDHYLVAAALADLIKKFDNYDVLLVAENGRDLLEKLEHSSQLPDIVLLDINMPEMDGFETASQLRQRYPTVRVLVLSMNDREDHLIRMVRNGARGYLLKGCRPSELNLALNEIMTKGFYYSEYFTTQLIRNLTGPSSNGTISVFNLNEREYEFLKLACSDLTYNDIADRMSVSPRTVDGYREAVFQKMNVKNRVSMAIKAVKYGLIDL
ncbi:response regulator transcription factor [Spirosoma aerolatum]|uniref:response regulator transcription factor n=1 Tax=Spirosoma aerolatum TaxID=1211326 RepID=UPI0009AC2606|nr:response regulator transcription factor [Spirosoma aerolatum]